MCSSDLGAAAARQGHDGAAQTAAPPRGTYAADVHGSSPAIFDGHWAMTFSGAGAVTVTLNGVRFDTGKVSFDKTWPPSSVIQEGLMPVPCQASTGGA